MRRIYFMLLFALSPVPALAAQGVVTLDGHAADLEPAPGNPGAQTASPGASATALVFRLSEAGGDSVFTLDSATVIVTTLNNHGNAAISRVGEISLLRDGQTLGTVVNGGAGWSAPGNAVTASFTGLASDIGIGASADFWLRLSFTTAQAPAPAPYYSAAISVGGLNGGQGVDGAPVAGGWITLADPSGLNPLAEEEASEGSCELSLKSGPAWPLAKLWLLGLTLGLGYRRKWKCAEDFAGSSG